MTDEHCIDFISRLFAGSPRPAHFTDYTHCSECRAHDETLQRYMPETLPLEPVCHPGWDPICFINPEGFRYYFPALVRLALTTSTIRQKNAYLPDFLFHLSNPDCPVQHFALFTPPQREAVLTFLRHIHDQHQETLAFYMYEDTLKTALGQWEKFIAEKSASQS